MNKNINKITEEFLDGNVNFINILLALMYDYVKDSDNIADIFNKITVENIYKDIRHPSIIKFTNYYEPIYYQKYEKTEYIYNFSKNVYISYLIKSYPKNIYSFMSCFSTKGNNKITYIKNTLETENYILNTLEFLININVFNKLIFNLKNAFSEWQKIEIIEEVYPHDEVKKESLTDRKNKLTQSAHFITNPKNDTFIKFALDFFQSPSYLTQTIKKIEYALTKYTIMTMFYRPDFSFDFDHSILKEVFSETFKNFNPENKSYANSNKENTLMAEFINKWKDVLPEIINIPQEGEEISYSEMLKRKKEICIEILKDMENI